MEKVITAAAFTLAALIIQTGRSWTCSPAPSCWMNEGPAYLRSICRGYAKDGRTLKQIATYVDEPEKVAAFGKACKKFNINLKPG